MSEWVSVKDSLPKESNNYIVCEKGNDTSYECWYDDNSKSWYHDRGGYQSPTHWMPLPSPPTDTDKI